MRLHLKLERLAWHRLSLTAKIWLSIGIFALGFVFSTTVDQIQGLQTERRLQVASEVSFPAALQGQRSEAAFQRTQKLLEAAVVMQDPSGLDRAGFEGETAEDNLQSLAAIPGLPLPYQSEAERLRVEIGRFLLSCKAAYGPIADDPAAIAASDLARMGDLSARSGLIERSLQQLKDRLTGDLQRQLGLLEAQSARRRWLNLAILTLTLAAATVLVNLTIRHAIMRPLMQAQADLAYERDLLRVLLDNVPDSIYFKDPDGRFIRVNRAQCALLGLRTEDEAVSRSDFDFFDESTARRVYEDEREIVRSGKPMVSKVERVSSKRGARW